MSAVAIGALRVVTVPLEKQHVSGGENVPPAPSHVGLSTRNIRDLSVTALAAAVAKYAVEP
jgi:hypothetical protein